MAQHDFKKTFFKHPVWCTYCKEFLWGVTKSQGSKCKVCKAIVHEKCRSIAGQCPGTNFYKNAQNKNRPQAPPPTSNSTGTVPQNTGGASTANSASPVNQANPQPGSTTTGQVTTPPNNGLKCLAKALFDFPPENERELDLKIGDTVEVLRIDDEWWFGVTQDNKEGYFPGTYVEKIGQW